MPSESEQGPLGDFEEEISDRALLDAVRRGDESAFSTLWSRHISIATRVAGSLTQSFDAEDVVSEAYMRVWSALRSGKGPTESFRPYLFATVRNVVLSWARKPRELNPDAPIDTVDPRSGEAASAAAAEASLVIRAFRTLPQRWQEVLWWTEVDGETPAQVGQKLGISANSAAALGYRAREGLRQAWVQEHVMMAGLGGDHLWVRERVGQHARGALSAKQDAKFVAHLAECRDCESAVRSAVELSSTFTPFLLPVAVGILLATGVVVVAPDSTASAYASDAGGDSSKGNANSVWSPHKRRVAAAGIVALMVVGGGAAALVGAADRLRAEQTVSAPASKGPQPSPPGGESPAPEAYEDRDPQPAPTAVVERPPRSQDAQPSPPVSAPPAPPSPLAPPAVPQAFPLTVSTVDTGEGALFPVLSGVGRPGAAVTLTAGFVTTTAIVDGFGEWKSSPIPVRAGKVDITVGSDGVVERLSNVRIDAPVLSASRRGGSLAVLLRGVPGTPYELAVNSTSLRITTNAEGVADVVLAIDETVKDALTASAVSGSRSGPQTVIDLP